MILKVSAYFTHVRTLRTCVPVEVMLSMFIVNYESYKKITKSNGYKQVHEKNS